MTTRLLPTGWFLLGAILMTTFSAIHSYAGITEGPAQPSNLRCEYRVNPLGIDELHPRFSWEVRDASRGAMQSAYQILVAHDAESLNKPGDILWDTGKVLSDQSIQVPYDGPALESGQLYYWTVRTWDEQGKASPYSRPAFWSMGLLSASDWKGKWIGQDEQPETPVIGTLSAAEWIWYPEGNPQKSAPVAERYFRTTVTIPSDATIVKAESILSVDNHFTLFINGQNAGSGTQFRQAKTLDITQLLHPGKNAIAIIASNEGERDNPAGLLGCIQIELENAPLILTTTTSAWRTAKKEQPGWKSPDFDDSKWETAKTLGAYGATPWGEVTIHDPNERALPARMTRREFTLDQPIKRATAYICGLGYYELRMNGSKIGDHVLDPGLTDYSKRALYATYDVTNELNQGINAVGIILGNGRYYAPRLTDPFKTITYGFPKVLFQLHVEYKGGSVTDIVSDDSWALTTEGPIRENNDYDGEVYDARMEQPGWDKPGFNDADWNPAEQVAPPSGILVSQMAEPIRVTRTLQPIQMTSPTAGVYIYDMGKNMVGWARLTVQGPRGTEINMRFAERLNEDGTLFVANLRSCKVTDTYILKGEGVETYEPRFTYHGFRYVELTGFPGEPDLSAIEGKVVHSDAQHTGAFTCSNELINRLHENILWGVRGNLRSIPTDCPQRDERQGWLGDIANQAKAEMYDFNMPSLFAKWLNDIDDAQTDKGSIPDVAPAYWPIYSDNITWPSAYLILPRWYYDIYADAKPIEKHYPSMCRWIDYMSKFLDKDIMPRDQYGDWCVPPESPELIHSKDPARKTPGEFLGTVYFCYDLELMARYATILGKTDDAKRFTEKANAIRKAFNDRFLDLDNNRYANGAQTTSVLPLAFNVVPESQRETIFECLVDNITNQCDGHIGTGLVGGQWLMRTLSDMGRADLAFQIATNRTYPSWGYMVDNGATTVWELWNGDSANPAMNSGNHLMLVGDLGIWMYEYLGGIRPDPANPGFKEFTIAPLCFDDLNWTRAEIQSMHGRIRSAWWHEGNARHLEVTIPANTQAKVRVPTCGQSKPTITESDIVLMQNGTPANGEEAIQYIESDTEGAWFLVGSGRYHFVSEDAKQ